MEETNTHLPDTHQIHCPYCCETISSQARKCKHCGEFFRRTSWWKKALTKVGAYIGVFTALLSVFYACREGYFYVQLQQQARTEKATYLQTADAFIKMDALDYAQQALSKALTLSPNDAELQRRIFLIEGHDLLRDLGWETDYQALQGNIKSLIMEGFRLLQVTQSKQQLAQLEVIVGQLLSYDQGWNDDLAITSLLESPLKFAPDNPEFQFQLGTWLVVAEIDMSRGVALVKSAAQNDADNAVYWAEYGTLATKQKNFVEGFSAFSHAISLLPKLKSIQDIRASNLAKTKLRQLFMQTHQDYDFTKSNFLGLDITQRIELIEQVSTTRKNDREIASIAARFYFGLQNYQRTHEYLLIALSKYDLSQEIASRDVRLFEIYADVLEALDQAPTLQKQISEKLNRYRAKENLTKEGGR
jgi:hypothetical protein